MAFVVDNLQYYLQVCAVDNTVINGTDVSWQDLCSVQLVLLVNECDPGVNDLTCHVVIEL